MSKLLLKISSVTALVTAAIYFFIFVIVHIAIPYNYLADNMYDYVCVMTLGVSSLISAMGGILFLRYKELSNSDLQKRKRWILFWSIILTLTFNIAGVIGLGAYFWISNKVINNRKKDYLDELEELAKLRDTGLITEDEFTLKKKKILDL